MRLLLKEAPVSETVLAYDQTGDALVPTPCEIGAVVEWKRSGMRWSALCRVLEFRGERMKLQPLLHSWHPDRPLTGARPVWAKRRVLKVLTPQHAAERGLAQPEAAR